MKSVQSCQEQTQELPRAAEDERNLHLRQSKGVWQGTWRDTLVVTKSKGITMSQTEEDLFQSWKKMRERKKRNNEFLLVCEMTQSSSVLFFPFFADSFSK